MRLNAPVTQIEYELSDSETIVSTTDLQGNITYANPYFIEVSGFAEEELLGAPQNILRHPDMPVEAFADLWATVQSGLPWTGMVKNRCKNGNFYWVLANVTPVMEGGRTVGYMSVRAKPTRQQVAEAAALYQEIKSGNPGKITLHQGAVVTHSLLGRLNTFKDMSLERRIGWNVSFLVMAIAILTASHFFQGAKTSGGSNFWLVGLSAAAITALLLVLAPRQGHQAFETGA
jgi:aerotaxis receptor